MAKYAVVFWEMDKKGQKTSQSCSSCEAVNAKAAMMDFLGLYGPKARIAYDEAADTATVYNNPVSDKSGWTARKVR